jgi:hypothetical protein
MRRSITGVLTPNSSRSVAEILDQEHAHRAGAAARMACRLDLLHQAVETLSLSPADLGKRFP